MDLLGGARATRAGSAERGDSHVTIPWRTLGCKPSRPPPLAGPSSAICGGGARSVHSKQFYPKRWEGFARVGQPHKASGTQAAATGRAERGRAWRGDQLLPFPHWIMQSSPSSQGLTVPCVRLWGCGQRASQDPRRGHKSEPPGLTAACAAGLRARVGIHRSPEADRSSARGRPPKTSNP